MSARMGIMQEVLYKKYGKRIKIGLPRDPIFTYHSKIA